MSVCEKLYPQKRTVMSVKMLVKGRKGVFGIRELGREPDPWIYIGVSRNCMQTDLLKILVGEDDFRKDVIKYIKKLGSTFEEMNSNGVRLGWVECNPCLAECYLTYFRSKMKNNFPEYNLERGRTCEDNVPENFIRRDLKTWILLNYKEYSRFQSCPFKDYVDRIMRKAGLIDFKF